MKNLELRMSKSNVLKNLEKKKEPFTKRNQKLNFSITRTKRQYFENIDFVKLSRKVYG